MKSRIPCQRIVFIGAGNMAEALIHGLLKSGTCGIDQVLMTDVNQDRRSHMEQRFRVRTVADNTEAVKSANVVLLAVKPQTVPDVLREIKPCLPSGVLVISIAAGVAVRNLERGLGDGVRVIRVMPNMPALVGLGAAAYCCGQWVTDADAGVVEQIFSSVGEVARLEESFMDAVTALSGSGPAYVFYLAEAMLEAARRMGLEEKAARRLITATIEGSGRLLKETGDAPEQLRARVTSKGGTTAAAMEVIQKAGVLETLVSAFEAARKRAEALSKASNSAPPERKD